MPRRQYFREGTLKLPRRNFLHLAAGAAALPFASCFAWAQPIRRGWCGSSSPFLQAKPPTPSRGSWVNRCRSGSGSHSSLRTERVPATISAPKASCGQRLTVIRAPCLLGCRTRCTRHVLACKIESLAAPSRRSGRRFWVAGKGPEVRLGGPSSSQTLESRSMLSRKIACIRRTTENLDGRARFVSPSGIYRETYALSPIMRDITLAAKLARFFLRGLQ